MNIVTYKNNVYLQQTVHSADNLRKLLEKEPDTLITKAFYSNLATLMIPSNRIVNDKREFITDPTSTKEFTKLHIPPYAYLLYNPSLPYVVTTKQYPKQPDHPQYNILKDLFTISKLSLIYPNAQLEFPISHLLTKLNLLINK